MDPFSLQNILTWYIKPNLKCRFPNGRQSIKGILLARNIKKHFYVKMVVTIVKRRRAQKKNAKLAREYHISPARTDTTDRRIRWY